MKITKNLNLVVKADTERGEVFVHSTPISVNIFEKYVFIISKTLSTLYEEGLTVFAGPRVAAITMKNIAIQRNIWDGPDGVENGLMNEIRRLTNVVMPGENGWESIPYHDAIKSGVIDAQAASEIEGQLVFFTCVSRMHRPKEIPALLDGISEVWGTQSTSLNSTEFQNSLPTSTPAANTGEKVTVSSIPS